MTLPVWSRTGPRRRRCPGRAPRDRRRRPHGAPPRAGRPSSPRVGDRLGRVPLVRRVDDALPLRVRLAGGEHLAVRVRGVSDDAPDGDLAPVRSRRVDHGHADGHSVDLDRERDRLPGLLHERLEIRLSHRDELGVALGQVRRREQRRTKTVLARDLVGHQVAGAEQGAGHAIGGHARQAEPSGHLVEAPLTVLGVEQGEHRQPLGQCLDDELTVAAFGIALRASRLRPEGRPRLIDHRHPFVESSSKSGMSIPCRRSTERERRGPAERSLRTERMRHPPRGMADAL